MLRLVFDFVSRMSMPRVGSRALAASILALASLPSAAQSLAWASPFGAPAKHDHPTDAASDGAGGVFVCGHDYSGPGWPGDAWIMRYDGVGTRLWIRYLGTPQAADAALAVAPDGAGGVFASGYRDLSYGSPPTASDAWVARYDGAGNLQWMHQLGTHSEERAEGIAPDGAGGVYVSGSTAGNLAGQNAGDRDAWLARYDGAGNQVWIRQIGSSGDESQTLVAADGAGGVFLCGSTTAVMGPASAGKSDVWVARYDSGGNLIWIRQDGSAENDYLEDASSDAAGRLFLCGRTEGAFGGPYVGWQDAWLGRYDPAGSLVWVRQMGTRVIASALAVAADGLGGVYVGGAVAGPKEYGWGWNVDPWLSHYSSAGNPTWMERFGLAAMVGVSAAAPDGAGGVYVGSGGLLFSGTTGALGDSWVSRYFGP